MFDVAQQLREGQMQEVVSGVRGDEEDLPLIQVARIGVLELLIAVGYDHKPLGQQGGRYLRFDGQPAGFEDPLD